LYEAQSVHAPDRLGENATRDFVLQHVFGIVAPLVKATSDLMRVLLRRHYKEWDVPETLDERLVDLLRRSRRFKDWPLEEIVPSRVAFLSFLQERWPIFLDRLARSEGYEIKEPPAAYKVQSPGPEELPCDNADVRVYIDNLFLEGFLRPVSHPEARHFTGRWVAAGLKTDPQADEKRRFEGLLDNIEQSVPELSARRGE
jgi:hypothetical protein